MSSEATCDICHRRGDDARLRELRPDLRDSDVLCDVCLNSVIAGELALPAAAV